MAAFSAFQKRFFSRGVFFNVLPFQGLPSFLLLQMLIFLCCFCCQIFLITMGVCLAALAGALAAFDTLVVAGGGV